MHTQHALQTNYIAMICQAPDYIIIGLLLHDICKLIGLDLNFTTKPFSFFEIS